MGKMEWTGRAKWKIRGYVETEEIFERRISRAVKVGTEYRDSTSSSSLLWCLKSVVRFTSSTLLAVLVLFTLINESILLHVQAGGQNLLWYFGILGICYAASKDAGREKEQGAYLESKGSGGEGGEIMGPFHEMPEERVAEERMREVR